MNRARILTTLGAFALCLFLGWYAGIDYMQRSIAAAAGVLESILVALLVYILAGLR